LLRGAVHFDATNGSISHPKFCAGMKPLSDKIPAADIKKRQL